MIVRARTLVPVGRPPIDNGAVAISGERITGVGSFHEIQAAHRGELIDLGERILLPGLINAHCHLDYTSFRGRIPPPRGSFTDWIRAINCHKQTLGPADYLRSIDDGFAEARKFGTTSMVNFTGFPELASKLLAPIRTWWVGELIDVRSPKTADQLVKAAVEDLLKVPRAGLAPHSPFTGSQRLYQSAIIAARRYGWLLSTHLAESRDEAAMFLEATGPLYDLLAKLGRDMSDCGGKSPVNRFLSLTSRSGSPDSVPGSWIVAHLNELTNHDLMALAALPGKFHVAHCPRSHRYFRHAPFRFTSLRESGFNICLGTDSLASNDDLNLFAEMRCFHQAHPEISPLDVVQLATANPAAALGQEHALGRIAEGFMADLIAIADPGSEPYESILHHKGAVTWSMIAGKSHEN